MLPDEVVPVDTRALAKWFAEGVRAEVAALEKEGSSRTHELLSGRLVRLIGADQAEFEFILADPSLVPEDASGRLSIDKRDYIAVVIGRQGNRLSVLLEGLDLPVAGIARALLSVDDTALLRRLADVLEKRATGSPPVSDLGSTVFHPEKAEVGLAPLPELPCLVELDRDGRQAVEQACGSSLTYIWGPPGTGKTFTLARLIAVLVAIGQRVLVTSHTHAAVDQVLYEAVSAGKDDKVGPLCDGPLVRQSRVLRVGRIPHSSPRVPESVRLDRVLEAKAEGLNEAIRGINRLAKPLSDRLEGLSRDLECWKKLDACEGRYRTISEAVTRGRKQVEGLEQKVGLAEHALATCLDALERAERSWFMRGARVGRAAQALRIARAGHTNATQALSCAREEYQNVQGLLGQAEAATQSERLRCKELLDQESLERQARTISAELAQLTYKRKETESEIAHLQERVISEARVIFCTLTANYHLKDLDGQQFDAVIIDEVSMALPPMVFLAAGRAGSRVVLAGDFKQLPPIVRSDSEVSNRRLGKDVFELSGVVRDGYVVQGCSVLSSLPLQRRMVPGVADVARALSYGEALHDHPRTRNRKVPDWMSFLPPSPAVIIDTADLHAWCGRRAGNLSRFNLCSASVCLSLAAKAASLTEPPDGQAQPIGIVTPYAAQRRLLSKMITELGLERWVLAGTPHTFQGGEADLIVFDSVVDEPHYSARLCNPRNCAAVVRELNVAVTRARTRFVFVGSSEWLNRNARAGGLGALWSHLKDKAPLRAADEVIGRALLTGARPGSPLRRVEWTVPTDSVKPRFEILDESSFFTRFTADIEHATTSIFGLVAYFGEYRWPHVQPLFQTALKRGVQVTLLVAPPDETSNRTYAGKAIRNLRDLGAVIVQASGLHGKDVAIDERVLYTGSLNWASHRGRAEIMHRIESTAVARLFLEYMQARYIREALVLEDGGPRICPGCGGPVQLVNVRQMSRYDPQPLKVGCASYQETECKYLRDIGERPPFMEAPRCQVDGETRYRRLKRGRGEEWQCPKHPKTCRTYRVVPGDLQILDAWALSRQKAARPSHAAKLPLTAQGKLDLTGRQTAHGVTQAGESWPPKELSDDE